MAILIFSCIEPAIEEEGKDKERSKLKDLYILNTGKWEFVQIIPFSDDYGNAQNGLINNATSTIEIAEMSYRDFINEPLTLSINTPDDDRYYYKVGVILTFWNGIHFCEGHYTYHVKGKNNCTDFYISDSFAIKLKAKKIIHYAGAVNTVAKYEANEKIDIKVYSTSLQLVVIQTSEYSDLDNSINSDLQLGLYRKLK